jgi:hypothetical protein
VDAAALKLTPDETEALLDFSPDSPAYAAPVPPLGAAPSPVPPSPVPDFTPDEVLVNWMKDETGSEELPQWEAPSVPGTLEMTAPDEQPAEPVALPVEAQPPEETAETFVWSPDAFGAARADEDFMAQFEDWTPPAVEETASSAIDGLPLAEREPITRRSQEDEPYHSHPAVDALIPQQPEQWSGPLPVESEEPAAPAETGAGGSLTADAQESVLVDPFLTNNKEVKRPSARTLFDDTTRADRGLLNLLVDDDRIRKLSQQIEALQEDLAQNVYGDRRAADTYQKELLQASSLLMASRENYDDARAIVYRIRTDMNRQRKVEADIRRYRPLLLNYYIGWGIALVVLFLLKALFTGVTDAVGVGVAAALYYPMLLGVGGSLLSGYLTLERHTTRLRDFDPLHISWYLFNPLLGSVMGLLMFLLASIANDDLLSGTANDAENAITYLLCVVAGMNQSSVLHQLNDLLKRFNKSNGS